MHRSQLQNSLVKNGVEDSVSFSIFQNLIEIQNYLKHE